jgi:integrase
MGRRLTGSVRPFGDKWRAYVGREYLGVFDSEAEAWRTVNAWLAIEGKRGTKPDTLSAFAAEWLDQREVDGHVRNVDDERSIWRTRIAVAPFADWPLRRIKPRHIQAWLRDLLKRKAQYTLQTTEGPERHERDRALSRQSVVHARRVLKGILEDAVIAGKIPSNPVADVRMPKRDDDGRDGDLIVFATQAEIDRLFALDLAPFERAAFSLAVYTGLTEGEIWGLRLEDLALDAANPHVRVRRSYDGPPKTKWRIRDVPLLAPAREAVEAWRRRKGVTRIGGLLFPADGGGCHHSGYDAGWADHRERIDGKLTVRTGIRSRAGIRREVTFHCLRHTNACHLLQGTWVPKLHARPLTLVELKHWLGHSSILVTEKHYARLAPGNLHDAVRVRRGATEDEADGT